MSLLSLLFKEKLPMDKILALRSTQYVQCLYVEDIVDPTKQLTKETPLPLTTLGPFLVLSFTGFYTCLQIKDAGEAKSLQDLGVCPLRMNIQAGGTTLKLWGNYVPMQLIMTPGRVRVSPYDAGLINGGWSLADADIGPVPNQLFYPYGYNYPFEANELITIQVKNDFDTASMGFANRWGICFYGIRIRDIGPALREVNKGPATKK